MVSPPDVGSQPSVLRVRRAVLDTGPLTTDVISSARRGLPSPLALMMDAGLLRGFAAHHVWAEVPRTLQKRAGRSDIAYPALEQLWWQRYVPLIRFVDCTSLPNTDQSRRLARRDPDDVDTLVLAGLIAPTVLIAEDPNILASGLAYEQWKDFYDMARDIGAGAGQLHAAAAALVLGGHGTAAAVKGLARIVHTPIGKGMAVAGGIAVLLAAMRWGPALRTTWQRGRTTRHEILRELGSKAAETLGRLKTAENLWRGAERGDPGDLLVHRVARILASAPAPMTRTELAAELGLYAPREGSIRIGRLLHTYAAFVPATSHRWQLGRGAVDFNDRRSSRPAAG